MNRAFTVYVCPVSGEAFTCQLALLCEINIANINIHKRGKGNNTKPDMVLASSGGNIAAYVALMAGWNANGIYRLSKLIESGMLIQNWWPEFLSFLPSGLIGIFSGSLYRLGYGVRTVFSNFLTKVQCESVDMWTGTFHKKTNKAQFFSNKSEGETHINSERLEKDMKTYDCAPLFYTNGDLDTLADVSVASASIPCLVQEKYVGGSAHSDGGIAYASPLCAFSMEILRVVEETKKSLHMVYFSCYNMELVEEKYRGIKGNFGSSLASLIRSLSVLDRGKGFEMISVLAKDRKVHTKHYKNLNTKKLSSLLESLNSKKHYFLNLYPTNSSNLNMLKFEGEDVIDCIEETRRSYGAYLSFV